MKTAQEMLDLAYADEAEGTFSQKLFDGREVMATDFGETILLRDFRPSTVEWTDEQISFDRLRALINESEEAESIAKHGF